MNYAMDFTSPDNSDYSNIARLSCGLTKVRSFRSIDFGDRMVAHVDHDLPHSRSRAATCCTSERSTSYHQSQSPWDIKPIDLSIKKYSRNSFDLKRPSSLHPNGMPNRRTRHGLDKGKGYIPKLDLPMLLRDREKTTISFQRQARPISAFTSKLESIREQTLPKDGYTAPRPHAFRNDCRPFRDPKQMDEKDFTTKKEKDPLSLKFRNEMLHKTIPELSSSKSIQLRDVTSEPIPSRSPEPKWNKDLYLPKGIYKRGRTAQSALYERMQQRLAASRHFQSADTSSLRPDIFDYKTVDFLSITRSKDSLIPGC